MSKLKWLKFGLSMAALGAAAVTLPIALTSCNDSGSDENAEQAINGEQAFKDAVQSSALLKIKDFSTPQNKCVYDSNNQPIEAIKTYFINCMSGTGTKLTVNSVNGNTPNLFQCAMSKNTLTYFSNLFGDSWDNIIGQSQNNDLKNIKQVSFGFTIGTVQTTNPDSTKLDVYKIFPKFLQFSWESANKPSWLQKDSIRIPLNSGDYKNIVYVNKSTFSVNSSVTPAPTDGGLVSINQLTTKATN